MIVVDIGCFAHGDHATDSITSLVNHFNPQVLFGFDPLVGDAVGSLMATTLITRQLAAWTRSGEVEFTSAGTQSSTIGPPAQPSTRPPQPPVLVPCFDLAAWLFTLPGEVIVKIDAEGAELPLLRHLHKTKADERITLLLVEEHPHLGLPRLPKVSCPVEEWWM